MVEITLPTDKLAALRANGDLELNGGPRYFPNEYCTLADETNPKRTVLARANIL